MSLKVLQPAGWPLPKGYANGMEGRGRHIIVGGMIGWDSHGRFAPGFVGQVKQALVNVITVVREAGGGLEHIARLTWFVTDIAEYRSSLAELGLAYRAVLGRHFPAMTLVQVGALVEPEARVEIEATAIIPD